MLICLRSFATGATLCALTLLVASTAQAQTSASGHVPARMPYAATDAAYRIFPGDHLYQATMKIQHYYQDVERQAPTMAYRAPAPKSTHREDEAMPVEVSITDPAGVSEMIAIRGPNGEVRSFPIVGGRQAIKARTIIVHPGERLKLVVQGGRVVVLTK